MILLFFLITSFRGHVELNWIVPALPFVFLIAAAHGKLLWFRIHNVMWGALILIVLTNHWLPVLKIPDRLRERDYFQPLVEIHRQFPDAYFSTYQMASMTWYLSKIPAFKLPEISRIDYFDKINVPFPTQDFVLVREINALLPLFIAERGFKIEKIENINNDFEMVYFKKQ